LRVIEPRSLERTNPALVVAAGVAAYHDTKFRELKPFDDVIPLLSALRAAGVTTGIVTHGWTTKQMEKLVRLGLVSFLDPKAIFISEQIGISKPNPKLYQRACAALGLDPREVMYVGDNPLHDVDPVNAVGMIPVRLHRDNRFAGVTGASAPRYEIRSFDELVPVLEKDFGLVLPP